MAEITYTKCGDYYIPNLRLAPQPTLRKYGRLRRDYLREHRPVLFNHMVLTETLYKHCAEIDDAAQDRLETMMPLLAKECGATEKLKAENQLLWVGKMNQCKAQVEEIIFNELVYV